jgi:hypothetical protein
MCIVKTVAMVILFWDFGPCGTIFMNVCVTTFVFPVILDGQFKSLQHKAAHNSTVDKISHEQINTSSFHVSH